MNGVVRRQFGMAERVRDLVRTRPFGAEKADAVVTQFEERVDRSQALIEQEAAGKRAAHAGTQRRADLRRRIGSESLRHVARIARAAAKDQPELAGKFRAPLPKSSEQEFRAVARAIAAQVAANKELFLKHGMWDGALDELNRQLEEYDQAVVEGNAGRAAHTGARSEMRALGSELVAMVRQLEGMMLIRFREDPNLKGAWRSARNVAWPLQPPGGPPATPPGQTAA